MQRNEPWNRCDRKSRNLTNATCWCVSPKSLRYSSSFDPVERWIFGQKNPWGKNESRPTAHKPPNTISCRQVVHQMLRLSWKFISWLHSWESKATFPNAYFLSQANTALSFGKPSLSLNKSGMFMINSLLVFSKGWFITTSHDTDGSCRTSKAVVPLVSTCFEPWENPGSPFRPNFAHCEHTE